MEHETMESLAQRWAEVKEGNPGIRIRNAAAELGVSEMKLLMTDTENVKYLGTDAWSLLQRIGQLGRVMALTRNDDCVIEKKGEYLNASMQGPVGLFVGRDIDLRLFMSHWSHAFAVSSNSAKGVRRSIQFFSGNGTAIHKVYLLEESNLEEYGRLLDSHGTELVPAVADKDESPKPRASESLKVDVDGFQEAWRNLEDTHDFHMLLRRFGLSRTEALRHAPEGGYAVPVKNSAARQVLTQAAEKHVPIMIFVGNPGALEIHSGPIENVVDARGWLNVLDEGLNLHLKEESIVESWIVRKPSRDGTITSLECFNTKGEMVVQFFGERKPGIPQREDWTALADGIGNTLAD